jgi:signal transduction histidine kinase
VFGERSGGKAVYAPRIPVGRTDRFAAEARRFELLIDQLSAAMAHARADAVDDEIEAWLGKICIALDLDRSGLHQHFPHENRFRLYKTWLRPGYPPFPPTDDPIWSTEKIDAWILAGNPIVFSHPSEIPVKFPDLRRFVSQYGPKASVLLPMWGGDQIIGGATFGRFRSPKKWNPDLLRRLDFAVRLFGSAIERKQAEAAARLAQEELALTQRRSIMAELIGSLAHELNQPLGAIMSNLGGLARLVSKGRLDTAVAVRAINNAMEDTRRASEIMRRVRSMFKGNVTEKVALDLGDLVNDVVRLLAKEAIKHNVIVNVDAQRSVPKILGDHILLQQCVLNLLMNAFEAIAKSAKDHKSVTIAVARESSGSIAIRVTDNGPGIDESVAGRLFEPFVTTKGNGMGLGLLVTRSIVEQHGGEISFDSNPDGGAIFTFTIPIAEVNPRKPKSSRGSNKRVIR